MKRRNVVLVVIGLLALHAFLGWQTIQALSPTYDEHAHLVTGYTCLTCADYRLSYHVGHPPVAEMWAALPLLFMKPVNFTHHPYYRDVGRYLFPYADLFMYHNRVDPEKMLAAGRVMILLLSLALGLLLFRWGAEFAGPGAGLIALFLWALFPGALANGTLVTTDTAVTFFYAVTAYVFWRWWRAAHNDKWASAAIAFIAGISAGLMLASKFSAIVILPLLGVVAADAVLLVRVELKRMLHFVAVTLLMAALVLLAIYHFNPLSENYLAGMTKVLTGLNAGRSSFFWGQYSTTGWLSYFPSLFLLKTPIPLLVIIGAAAFSRGIYRREILLFVLFPALLYFAVSCVSKTQIGHRHILPVYPFVILGASIAVAAVRRPLAKAAMAVFLVWYAAGTFLIHPWHISYFNEFVGSPDRGYLYFTDSNTDWGQGLKELGSYLRRQKVNGIFFSYFGTGDPAYYGISYRPVGFVDTISPPNTVDERSGDPGAARGKDRVIVAVSATNLQGTYYASKDIFSFLKSAVPEAVIAHSILVYDLSKHPEQMAVFQQLLSSLGIDHPAGARRRASGEWSAEGSGGR